MRRPQPWGQESFHNPFFKAYVATAVDRLNSHRLQDNVLLKGENDVRLGRPCEAVGPPDAGVGEVDVAPGGLGLVLGNLSDEPLWLVDGDEEGRLFYKFLMNFFRKFGSYFLSVRCYTLVFWRCNIEQNEFFHNGNFEHHIRNS